MIAADRKNRQRALAKKRVHYRKNRQRILASQHAYYRRNLQKIRVKHRAYRRKNWQRLQAKKYEYYHTVRAEKLKAERRARGYVPPLPCPHGYEKKRACHVCTVTRTVAWAKQNRALYHEKWRQKEKAYKEKNKSHINAARRRWYRTSTHPVRKSRQYDHQNRTENLRRIKAWRQRNVGVILRGYSMIPPHLQAITCAIRHFRGVAHLPGWAKVHLLQNAQITANISHLWQRDQHDPDAQQLYRAVITATQRSRHGQLSRDKARALLPMFRARLALLCSSELGLPRPSATR